MEEQEENAFENRSNEISEDMIYSIWRMIFIFICRSIIFQLNEDVDNFNFK